MRVGLGTYGLHPCPATREVVDLRPALRVVSRVVYVQRLAAGERPSYGRRRALQKESNVATVPIGYADGVPRRLSATGGEVLIRGRRYPLAGTVTMDQIVVDVGDDPVEVGDEVVLIGRQGTEEITADEWAEKTDTISYEVVCDIGPASPQVLAVNETLTAIEGVRVGHWTNAEAATGCTVVVLPEPNCITAEFRGAAPGTREAALLQPGMAVEQAQAVVLTGGSAFGLAAADGVVRALEADGRGHPTLMGPVPIVPAAVVYDLHTGDPSVRPGRQGEAAYRAATAEPVPMGRVGAGAGTRVAGWRGFRGVAAGGLGSALVSGDGFRVGALAVVNSVGDVFTLDGEPLTGGSAVPGPPAAWDPH